MGEEDERRPAAARPLPSRPYPFARPFFVRLVERSLTQEAAVNAEHLGQDPLVIGLVETTTLDASEVGAKAANLGQLAREGFPVPPGLVVTPAAQGRWEEARTRLLEAAAELGAERFAVRSSGTAEDLEGASFAGQYETILGVPLEELPGAVERVFDSAGAPRVAAYREARAGPTGERAAPS